VVRRSTIATHTTAKPDFPPFWFCSSVPTLLGRSRRVCSRWWWLLPRRRCCTQRFRSCSRSMALGFFRFWADAEVMVRGVVITWWWLRRCIFFHGSGTLKPHGGCRRFRGCLQLDLFDCYGWFRLKSRFLIWICFGAKVLFETPVTVVLVWFAVCGVCSARKSWKCLLWFVAGAVGTWIFVRVGGRFMLVSD